MAVSDPSDDHLLNYPELPRASLMTSQKKHPTSSFSAYISDKQLSNKSKNKNIRTVQKRPCLPDSLADLSLFLKKQNANATKKPQRAASNKSPKHQKIRKMPYMGP